jgi:hypothetical protein
VGKNEKGAVLSKRTEGVKLAAEKPLKLTRHQMVLHKEESNLFRQPSHNLDQGEAGSVQPG